MAKVDNMKKVNKTIGLIEKGMSLIKALKQSKFAPVDFYEWLNREEANRLRYARACEERADMIFEEILEIADDKSQDTIKVMRGDIEVEEENKEWVNRSKIKIDARKWMLGKMQPKKYGDKIEIDQKSDVTISFK